MEKIIDRIFYADKWNIGYTYQSASNLIKNKNLNGPVTWLEEDTSLYAADPFVIEHGSKIYIIYEELQRLYKRGKIKLIKDFDFTSKVNVKGLGPKNIHLSYPHIFIDNDQVYCIPETAGAKEVGLYQFGNENFSEVKKKRVLLTGEPYLDSSLVKFQNKYWLFTSIKGRKNQLLIFYANSLNDEFIPHQLNPIATDEKSFRGGGNLFVVDDILYRPTQNLEVKYGGSVMMNQITDLSPNTYNSSFLFEILPEKPYEEGLHNISFSQNLIVLDGKRRVFSLTTPFDKLMKRIIYYTRLSLSKLNS